MNGAHPRLSGVRWRRPSDPICGAEVVEGVGSALSCPGRSCWPSVGPHLGPQCPSQETLPAPIVSCLPLSGVQKLGPNTWQAPRWAVASVTPTGCSETCLLCLLSGLPIHPCPSSWVAHFCRPMPPLSWDLPARWGLKWAAACGRVAHSRGSVLLNTHGAEGGRGRPCGLATFPSCHASSVTTLPWDLGSRLGVFSWTTQCQEIGPQASQHYWLPSCRASQPSLCPTMHHCALSPQGPWSPDLRECMLPPSTPAA